MPKYIITPVGNPRMTRCDKWKQRPPVMRYRMFCDEAHLHGIQVPENGAHITIRFADAVEPEQEKASG
jgi:hypothetical protein